jgi:hypothetical protein
MPISEGTQDFPSDVSQRHSWGMYDGSVLWLPRGDTTNGLLVDISRVQGGNNPIRLSPTINVGAYSAGFVVGGVLTFTNALRSGKGGGLASFSVWDLAAQKAGFTVLVFNANPTSGTYTDHAAPASTYGTDISGKFIDAFSIAPTDYKDFGTTSVATVSPFMPVKAASGGDLYAVMILDATSTPTYANANALGVIAGFNQD